jgi:hypothetical protein
VVAQVELDDCRLGNQFVVHVFHLDHDAAVHRLVLMGVVVLLAGRMGDARGGEGDGGDESQQFHGFPFGG